MSEAKVAELESTMNDLGSEDWELVSILGTNRDSGLSREVLAAFKRLAEPQS